MIGVQFLVTIIYVCEFMMTLSFHLGTQKNDSCFYHINLFQECNFIYYGRPRHRCVWSKHMEYDMSILMIQLFNESQ
jgi:hypothetical protein